MPNCASHHRCHHRFRILLPGLALAALLSLSLGAGEVRGARAAARAPAVPAASETPSPPANRNDLQGWLDYQLRLGSASMPAEAQMFYRRGVETLRAGAEEDGVRMLRGACQLDPTFLAPRLALLSHYGVRDLSQSLMEMARILDLAKTHFALQRFLLTSVAFSLALAVFLSTLACALYVVWRRRETLRHGYREFLAQFLSPRMAEAGGWALLALPFVAGLGLALPLVFTLAALWPGLRRSERALTVILIAVVIAIPIGFRTLGHLATPDHPARAPFYGTTGLAQAPYSQGRLAELRELSARRPENPFLHFAAAWMAYRGGQLPLAQEEFEAAARLWPNEPRVPNNLGNLAALAGRTEEAERLYRQAASLDPSWAMPHYNLGQIYTREFRYAEASEEMARATAFDFDMVRALQADAQAKPGDPLPLAWGWLAPRTFWDALLSQAPTETRVPPGWRGWLELRGVTVALLAVLMTILGTALGLLMRAKLPVRQCSNCEQALCRRCAARRRDQVYCADCSAALRESTTAEFARLLLARRRRQVRRTRARFSVGVAALLPGSGPLLLDRLGVAWVLLALASAGALALVGITGPFPYDPRVGPLAGPRMHLGGLAVLGAVWVASFAFYLLLRGSEDLREIQADLTRRPATRLARAA